MREKYRVGQESLLKPGAPVRRLFNQLGSVPVLSRRQGPWLRNTGVRMASPIGLCVPIPGVPGEMVVLGSPWP